MSMVAVSAVVFLMSTVHSLPLGIVGIAGADLEEHFAEYHQKTETMINVLHNCRRHLVEVVAPGDNFELKCQQPGDDDTAYYAFNDQLVTKEELKTKGVSIVEKGDSVTFTLPPGNYSLPCDRYIQTLMTVEERSDYVSQGVVAWNTTGDMINMIYRDPEAIGVPIITCKALNCSGDCPFFYMESGCFEGSYPDVDISLFAADGKEDEDEIMAVECHVTVNGEHVTGGKELFHLNVAKDAPEDMWGDYSEEDDDEDDDEDDLSKEHFNTLALMDSVRALSPEGVFALSLRNNKN
nr:hypothetical protein [Salmonid herpesvirus 1]